MPVITSDTETMSPPVETPLARDDESNMVDSPANAKFKTRRSVACKSCHNLKVKCTPADESNPSGPCIRCMNAKRKCEIDLHQPRKRRRKAEVLAAAANGVGKSHQDGTGYENAPATVSPVNTITTTTTGTTLTTTSNGNDNGNTTGSTGANSVPVVDEYKSDKDHIKALQDRVRLLEAQLNGSTSTTDSHPFVCKKDIEKELMAFSEINLEDITKYLRFFAEQRIAQTLDSVVDVVSMGIITMEEAKVRYGIYKQMYNSYPMVDIPENMDCEDLRARYPIFFNAMMSVSNALYQSDYNDLVRSMQLDNEATKTVALESIVKGTKSQELVKSLLLLCLWYNSAELFRQRRYHLLNGICVTLFHDLGATGKPQYSFKNDLATMSMSFAQDASIEYRGLILIVYVTTVSISLILRRNISVKWTSYVEDCCAHLEDSGNPRYTRTALMARLCRELDRIHHSIHQCDSAASSSSTIKFLNTEFENNLRSILRRIGPKDHILLSYYYTIEAYLHEPKLKEIFNTTDIKVESVKFDEYKMKQVSNCTVSCLNAINEFISLGPDQVALAPLFSSCRIVYTAGMLLRLRFLILSVPSLIDKSLVPIQAIQCVLQLLCLLDEAAKLHLNNHFLNKIRLILRLFVQTYVTQVRGLLKSNGETPQNFKSTIEDTDHIAPQSMEGMPNTNVPLDLLSYAASFRRDDKGDGQNISRHTPMDTHTTLSHAPSALPTLNGAEDQSSIGRPRGLVQVLHKDIGKLQPTLNQNQGGLLPHRTLVSHLPPIRIPTPNGSICHQGGEVNGGSASGGVSASSASQTRYSDPSTVGPSTTMFSSASMPVTGGLVEPSGKPDSSFFNFDLINTNPLDSTMSINEEFWGDLLSSNDANTLNFSRSNNDYQNQVDLFFR
ncbi:uncharacterized protein KQ657_002123 [Scheffersomyces spartinae]|uniref:Zn(2)-C6 fungal-type domain-containing protein n=1 Tax=Scheffersomyces spartinae TaxID=45513 RepID=A0A9P7VDB8_9ASCO|nr:uncharacterized protein KQ657_002123 [Scheffersomyces spartinae]KAG7195740.1 hypothetical protein KQ657_002123 [Scheffersomyces spartinae]